MSALDIVLAVALGLGGYLLGSIPFALVVGKWGFGVDVRDPGSGNVGTTNVFRVLGARAGSIVLVCDVTKGWAPAFVAGRFFPAWVAVIMVSIASPHAVTRSSGRPAARADSIFPSAISRIGGRAP